MANHFLDVGIVLDEYDHLDDLKALVGGNKGEYIEVNGKKYFLVKIDDRIELWFKTEDGEVNLATLEPHYRTDKYIEIMGAEWVEMDDSGMSGLLRGVLPLYPLNFNIPNAAMVPELQQDKIYACQAACFAESMEIYEDIEDFEENCEYGEGFNPQSVISTGCWNSWGADDVLQTSRAVISGIVKNVEEKENSYSNVKYYVITIESQGCEFDLLAAEDFIEKTPAAGNIVMGRFWLSGKIISR